MISKIKKEESKKLRQINDDVVTANLSSDGMELLSGSGSGSG